VLPVVVGLLVALFGHSLVDARTAAAQSVAPYTYDGTRAPSAIGCSTYQRAR
jgi:hypothetical protein